MKLTIAATVVVVVVLVVFLVPNLLVCRPTPQDITVTAMGEMSVRAEMYYASFKKLPQRVSDLPVREGHMNFTVDGWERPLLYEASEDKIMLRSYGADGVAGGSGKNADYEMEIARSLMPGNLSTVERKIDGGKAVITGKSPY
jgi:hypothetical protein